MQERIAHPHSAFLLCLALIALGVVVMAACVAPAPTPEPTATPLPTFTPQPPTAEDDWTRIKAAGVIQVASPLDNAPFNMYNEDRKPDGFDIVLMNDLARRLDLKVKYIDSPFEGLLGALQLGQADAAIGAMAITPERQTKADFTNLYYVGEDGILAAPDSGISTVTTKEDVVNRQVGTIRGSVYEWWLTENLIKTGEMPAANLHVYLRPDDVVRELNEGYVDLVVLDREPALTYEAQGKAKVVGKSKFTQNFGIPVRKGSTLLPHLNRALAAALADGTVSNLIEEYLNIGKENQLPIPTPQPTGVATATPTPAGTAAPAACTNGTGFNEADVDQTIPDWTVMLPGQQFTKTWRIINVGTCDWTTAYSFVNVPNKSSGGNMGGKNAPITAPVPKGSPYDVSVAMKAPSTPGNYDSWWQMQDPKGVAFAKQVVVRIVVQAPAIATPTPTSTPLPGVEFWADRYSIKKGESTWFRWKTAGVKEIYFYPEGESWQNHGVTGPTGQQEVKPSQSTSYYLRVVFNNNTDHTEERRITVEQTQKPPVINYLDSNPASQVTQGQSVTLMWDVTGSVDGVKLTRDGVQLYKGSAVHSSKVDTPPNTATYKLEASGPGGSAEPQYRTITVVPQVGPPVISRFDTNPQGRALQGDCVNLSWDLQGQVTGLALNWNGNPLPVDSPGGRSYQDCECPKEVRGCTYQLQAWGPGGNAQPQSRTLTVESLPQPPPQIVQFGSNPQGEVVAGQCVDVYWEVKGDYNNIILTCNGNPLNVASNPGDYNDCDCPKNPGSCQYELNVYGPGGNAGPSAFVVTVKPEAQPAPKITRFDANPQGSVLQGQCVNLSWDIQGGWDGMELTVNGTTLTGGAGPSNYQDCECPKNLGTCNYQLRVWNQSGEDRAEQSLEVIMQTLPGNPVATFCTDHGGQYNTENSTCTLSDDTVCDATAYANGECPAPQ